MIGDRLAKLRKERKLTQEDLAVKLGIVRSTYSNYESGKREPDLNTIELFAHYFDVTVDYLIGRTNDPKRTLQQHSRSLIDMVDAELTNEEILNAFDNKILIDGIPVTRDEAIFFINYVRTKRIMDKKQDSVLGPNKA